MKGINQMFIKCSITILFSAFIVSCASIPELKVHYQLPPRDDQLKGKKIVLVFEDTRAIKQIVGQGASKEFRGFSGSLSFSLTRYNEPELKMGLFQVPALMKKVFKRRLECLGLEVVFGKAHNKPQLTIDLNEFVLDLVNRKWVVKMSYKASLAKNGQVLASQSISGQVERYKTIGRGEADTAMGEIFTDVINRLDVPRLFRQAGL